MAQIEQLGPYKIGRKLGRGGMGTVFQAVHCETGEPAAIKLLSASLAHDDGFRERFKAEIDTLRKLRHPNIVRLFGFGEQDDYLFYAMELVDGRSLEDELQAGRRFDWREVTDFGVQTCRALKHAHDRGVIHRDLKPANLLLTPSGEIKLSDFGIAKLFGNTGMTASGGVLGTAEYMAPEQADGRPVTHRCDLYSLGGVLYALLARRPPFRASNLLEMLQLQRFAEPEPVRRYAPDAPVEMEIIISQLLEKDPEKRIPTAMVLARRLEAMRHGLSLRGDEVARAASPGADNVAAHPASPTMTAPSARGTEKDDPGYQLAAPIAPGDRTEADRRARSVSATVDLVTPTSKDPLEEEQLDVTVENTLGGRFVKISEEEHRRLETTQPVEEEPHAIWPQVLALALALVALVGGVWYFARPANAETLFGRIKAAADDDQMATLATEEPAIQQFLERFPDDPRADEVRGYQDDVELFKLDSRFEAMARKLSKSDKLEAVDRAYLEAINYARLNPELGMAKLQAVVDLYGSHVPDSALSKQCLELARKKLARFRQQIVDHTPGDLRILNLRLNDADDLNATNPGQARAIRMAVIEIYGDKDWAKPAVDRARRGLGK